MSSENLLYQPRSGVQVHLETDCLRISEQCIPEFNSKNKQSILSMCYTSVSPELVEIPYKWILWCCQVRDIDNSDILEVTYVKPGSRVEIKTLRVQVIRDATYSVQESVQDGRDNSQGKVSQEIIHRAYGSSFIRPSILVIINPHGGQGKALDMYNNQILPILRASKAKITYKETTYYQHAIDIAKELDVNEYDIVACCSGDGIPHEVINGFFQRPDKGASAFNNVCVTQLPCGTGNALALSTYGSSDAAIATLTMLKAKQAKTDLMAVTQGYGDNEVTKLSFLTQCYGVIADSDIGTEHLRWLGPIRFDLGIAYKVLTRAKYPCEIYVNYLTNSKNEISQHFSKHRQNASTFNSQVSPESFTLKAPKLNENPPSSWTKIPESISSNVSIFYVGKMPVISKDVHYFPAAIPDDGAMDMVIMDVKTSITETASILGSTNTGQHVHSDKVHHAKILSYRLVPQVEDTKNHFISVDGENFPFEPFQVEVLPGILTCLLPNGNFVDTCYKASSNNT